MAIEQTENLTNNVLSLDPNDDRWSGPLQSWQDGAEYDVTLKIRQLSPGEFEVIKLTPSAATEPAPEESVPMEDEQPMGDEYVNQGVRNLAAM